MGGVYYIFIVNLIFLYIEHMRRYILRIPSKSNQSNQLLAYAAAHMANLNAQTQVTILSASEKRKQKFIWKPTLGRPALA